MRTLHDVRRLLERVPQGFLADGRPLYLGLASALDAQRARYHGGPGTPTEVLPQQHEERDNRVPAGC
jgi:hypothetical protein